MPDGLVVETCHERQAGDPGLRGGAQTVEHLDDLVGVRPERACHDVADGVDVVGPFDVDRHDRAAEGRVLRGRARVSDRGHAWTVPISGAGRQ
ncbi:hypothetical protein Cch01nite_16690 [Cellulomonas chitinilytica]|uniref:Uncharacterized protein n=1 Tax=Cellulomonas chitinilytica TaxID=398759 RepID=A0A919TYT5_9CELL|nr:hypothetical protein Cch01nite_16690 [Cellulomonas chitinilytica]